jgi:hypothetical protein
MYELENPVDVFYLGGPLSGKSNNVDYSEETMEPGAVFDWPTRCGPGDDWPTEHLVGDADTLERYVLEHRPGMGWVFVHTGTIAQPPEQRAFNADVIGGPDDGTVHWLMGVNRRHNGARVDHLARGYELHHDGDDPAAGWQLRYVG